MDSLPLPRKAYFRWEKQAMRKIHKRARESGASQTRKSAVALVAKDILLIDDVMTTGETLKRSWSYLLAGHEIGPGSLTAFTLFQARE
jgi:predicted amidophosphoribosyltransferase